MVNYELPFVSSFIIHNFLIRLLKPATTTLAANSRTKTTATRTTALALRLRAALARHEVERVDLGNLREERRR